jgi:hypothetical protein
MEPLRINEELKNGGYTTTGYLPIYWKTWHHIIQLEFIQDKQRAWKREDCSTNYAGHQGFILHCNFPNKKITKLPAHARTIDVLFTAHR